MFRFGSASEYGTSLSRIKKVRNLKKIRKKRKTPFLSWLSWSEIPVSWTVQDICEERQWIVELCRQTTCASNLSTWNRSTTPHRCSRLVTVKWRKFEQIQHTINFFNSQFRNLYFSLFFVTLTIWYLRTVPYLTLRYKKNAEKLFLFFFTLMLLKVPVNFFTSSFNSPELGSLFYT